MFQVVSKSDEQRLVFGWAAVATVDGETLVDKQGDAYASTDVLEKAAYEFMEESRQGGDMHVRKGIGHVVESFVLTKAKAESMGIDPPRLEGWFIGMRVTDDGVWNRVKKGELSAFSIGGRGVREQA